MVPGPDQPPELDLVQIEADLRRQLSELEERLTEMKKPPERGSTVGFGKRVGDGTTEAVSRFTEVAVADNLEITATRIERAIEKLEDGSYGTCDSCGNPIAAGRLRVSPASSLCIDCARRLPG
ncbi:MAG: TraR/DksA family transcriptional regulator [Actinomycetota bacterium]|nr:TraR/DksA family transcriptional regulator [Actinomycetota bacterium]